MDEGSDSDDISSRETKFTDASAINITRLIMPAYYLGRIERVRFLAEKWEMMDEDVQKKIPIRAISIAFYHGLALVEMCRKRKIKSFLSKINSSVDMLVKGEHDKLLLSFWLSQ